MVLLAVVFDPRYKLKFKRFSFRKLYPNDFGKADEVYDHLYNVLKRLYDSYSSCVHVEKMIMVTLLPQSILITQRCL